MKVITVAGKMQRQAEALRKAGKKIAFVPTMGALHEGHLSLIRKAKALGNIVVVSIYVNPTQFGPNEDYTRYPRPLKQDLQLLTLEKVDFVFAPKTLYSKEESTFVEETTCSKGRCGASRPGHFRGVTTVVCKLLNIVQPHVAIFGQKDAQQCDVIERMVDNLFMPVKIVRAPIKRDLRGLALSSRNQYLSRHEYEKALLFPQAMQAVAKKKGLLAEEVERELLELLRQQEGITVDYVSWSRGFLCAAIRVGATRLIDNVPYKVKGKK